MNIPTIVAIQRWYRSIKRARIVAQQTLRKLEGAVKADYQYYFNYAAAVKWTAPAPHS
jgi:hypothetical protein